MKKVSILIPVFNEKGTLDLALKQLNNIEFWGLEKEIIIIDDGSTDGSVDLYKNNTYKILYHNTNKGKGAAIRTGLKEATGDIIVIQDADLEYSPEDLNEIVKKILNNECEVCCNSRFLDVKKSYKFLPVNYIGNKVLTHMTNILYQSNITDLTTCYKGFKKEVLDKIELKSNGFEIEAEIVANLLKRNIKIKEIPASKYVAREKSSGKKLKITDAFKIIYTLFYNKFK